MASQLMSVNGPQSWVEQTYSPAAVAGVSVLVVAATISFFAVLYMIAAIIITSYHNSHAFLRSHLGAYFLSLVLAEAIQAIGSLLSARWIALHAVTAGTFCAAQGALKNAGNVSTALWTMVIAFHTFCVVFLRFNAPTWVFYTTLGGVWVVVGVNLVLGPGVVQTVAGGPFWGVSGYWCWITDEYRLAQFMMEYFFMFLTATISGILYVIIFLRLRGNIIDVDESDPDRSPTAPRRSRFRYRLVHAQQPWQNVAGMGDPQIERIGKRMLLYPVIYIVLVLPIAACRWAEIFGKSVPFGMTIFADTVFVLSGLINAILYSTTRPVPPVPTVSSFSSNKSIDNVYEQGIESFQVGSEERGDFQYGRRGGPEAYVPHMETLTEEQYEDIDLEKRADGHDSKNAHNSASSRSSSFYSNSYGASILDGGQAGRQVRPAEYDNMGLPGVSVAVQHALPLSPRSPFTAPVPVAAPASTHTQAHARSASASSLRSRPSSISRSGSRSSPSPYRPASPSSPDVESPLEYYVGSASSPRAGPPSPYGAESPSPYRAGFPSPYLVGSPSFDRTRSPSTSPSRAASPSPSHGRARSIGNERPSSSLSWI